MTLANKFRVLAVYAVIFLWAYINYTLLRDTGNPAYGLIAALAALGTLSLVLFRRWSKLFLYVGSTLSVLTWIYAVASVSLTRSGCFGYPSCSVAFFGLLISAVPPMLGILSVFFVHRYFNLLKDPA